MKKNSILHICIVAMLTAISLVLMLLEFPVFSAMSHLKMDFSDIPALFAGVVYGPWTAVVIELLKNIIELAVKGLGTQMGFGNLMNFIVGCAYTVPFAFVYRKMKDKENKALLVSSVVGAVLIVTVGFVANYLVAPLFFRHFLGIELDNPTLMAAVWSATALNGVKGVLLSIVSFPIVKVLVGRLKKYVA